jgi:hypothetical protein
MKVQVECSPDISENHEDWSRNVWSRAGRYLKERHPELTGAPSVPFLVDLLLKEVGF